MFVKVKQGFILIVFVLFFFTGKLQDNLFNTDAFTKDGSTAANFNALCMLLVEKCSFPQTENKES